MRSLVSTWRRVASCRPKQVVQPGRGKAEWLHVQPRLVHSRDAALPGLAQPLPHLPWRNACPRVSARGRVEPTPRRDDLVGHEVLLSADRFHRNACFLSCHPRRPAGVGHPVHPNENVGVQGKCVRFRDVRGAAEAGFPTPRSQRVVTTRSSRQAVPVIVVARPHACHMSG